MKTSELEGDWLDIAVAKALGMERVVGLVQETYCASHPGWDFGPSTYPDEGPDDFTPSTRWDHGGPIIERYKIPLQPERDGLWSAACFTDDADVLYFADSSPLVAAMRAFVASKLGEEVELP